MSLGKRIDESGYPARSERRYMGGTVLSVDNAMYVATVDVGATDTAGNPIYKMATFNPQTPPHPGDRVQFVYTNSNPHSGMIVGGQIAGANPLTLNGVLPHPLLDNANDSDTIAHTPVAGDLITANATPKWAALGAGAPGDVLEMIAGSPNLPGWTTGGVSVEANGSAGVGPEKTLNFIAGTNIAAITAVDNTSASPHRVDITVNANTLTAGNGVLITPGSGSDTFSSYPYWPYASESANYSVPTTNTTPGVVGDTTSGDVTLTLPQAAAVGAGYLYYFKNATGHHRVIVAASGTDTLDGAVTTSTLYPDGSLLLVCGGASGVWYILAGTAIQELHSVSTGISANYTIGDHDQVLLCTPATSLTMTLPDASLWYNRALAFKLQSGTSVLLQPAPNTQTIDGAATFTLATVGGFVQIISDGSNWRILATGGLTPTTATPWTQTSQALTGAFTVPALTSPTAYFFSSAAAQTVTLPAASTSHYPLLIQKTDANTNLITVSAAGTDKVNGAASYTSLNAQYAFVMLMPDGSGNWAICSQGVGGADSDPVFVASGASHAAGLVPDPGAAAGTTRYLREDATWDVPPAGSGTVTSVGLALPAQFAVSGSPVTGSGTLTGAWNTQSANTALMGPTSGAAAAPAFRAAVANDIPATLNAGTAFSAPTTAEPNVVLDASSAVNPTTPVSGALWWNGTNLYFYNGSANKDLLSSGGTTSPLTTKGDLWGYTTTNARIPVGADSKILIADSSQADGVVWNYRPSIVLMFQPGVTEASWTIPSSVTTELLGLTIHRSQFDLTNFSEIRLSVTKSAAQTSVHGVLDVEYSTNGGTTWSTMDGSGNPGGQISGMSAGVNTTAWATLAAAAKADVLLRFTGTAGSGGAANFGVIVAEAR